MRAQEDDIRTKGMVADAEHYIMQASKSHINTPHEAAHFLITLGLVDWPMRYPTKTVSDLIQSLQFG